MSVDTYARKANMSAYQKVKDSGLEILISKALASRAAIVLIEQNLTRSLGIADFAYILQKGKIVLKGDPRKFSQEGIQSAYFGI